MQYTIVILTTIAMLAPNASARDPTFAITATIPINQETTAKYRIVSIAWLKYIAESKAPYIWLYVENLPNSWNGRNLTNKFERDRARSDITNLIAQTLRFYVTVGMRVPIRGIFAQQIDRRGVLLDLLPKRYRTSASRDDDLANFRLNRTIVVSFEDPPYGQSRTNRLVTNRNIPWHNSKTLRFQRSNRFTRIDTTDLRYRYAHNIGHLLGFGHYLNLTRTNNNFNRQRNNLAYEKRSVMFADTKDIRHAAQYTTGLDLQVVRYVVKYLDTILEKTVENMLKMELPMIIVESFKRYGKNIIA